jgi:DNA primase
MGFTRNSLDQLRAALNPLEIFREAVPSLKQAGRRWKGLCPFHAERTPSFTVDPERGLWHCFGACQTGGDVFAFVMRRENVAFAEAVRTLSERAGVRLEWEGRPDEDARAQKERDALAELLEDASRYYHRALVSGAEGETARRLLAERRVTLESVQEFRLGFAPSRNGFPDLALKKGVPVERILTAGLGVRGAGGGLRDPMSDRLCFPIFDPYGRVVGFGGRVLGEGNGPKYLNSPETPLYAKSRQLYGLFQGRAALRDRGAAVLVEGYMDVVGCHQAGVKSAVAPLGTAFGREQAKLLKRYVKEVVLLYDPDEAGLRASWRTARELLAEDVFIRVAVVPEGLDPDDYAAQKGAGALQSLVDGASDVVDFWLDRIGPQAGAAGGLQDRVRQAGELIAFLKSVPNALLQDEWLKKAARRLSLSESTLRGEMEKGPRAASPEPPGSRNSPGAGKSSPGSRPVRSSEEETLQFLAAHPEVWSESLVEDCFSDARCRAVFSAMAAARKAGRPPDAAEAAAALVPSAAGWWSGLVMEEKTFLSPAEDIIKLEARLKREQMRRELSALQAEVGRLMAEGAPQAEEKISRLKQLTNALKTT